MHMPHNRGRRRIDVNAASQVGRNERRTLPRRAHLAPLNRRPASIRTDAYTGSGPAPCGTHSCQSVEREVG